MIELRICTKCKRELPPTTEYFHKQKRGKYGLSSWCKECKSKHNKTKTNKYKEYNTKHSISFEGTKKCSKCKEIKSKTEFSISRMNKNGLVYNCKLCERKRILLKRHNITEDQYKSILYKQNNKCLICCNEFTDDKMNKHIDHNHKTDNIRGILCENCNRGLGMFKDNIEYLQNAIKYLMERK